MEKKEWENGESYIYFHFHSLSVKKPVVFHITKRDGFLLISELMKMKAAGLQGRSHMSIT